MLIKLDHINIVVSDLEATCHFFRQLGFSVNDSARLEGEWISGIVGIEGVVADYVSLSLPDNPTRIELIHYLDPASGCDGNMHKPNQLGFRHIAFQVDCIETEVKKLTSLGIKLAGSIQAYPKTGKKLVYFYGPDNILLEYAQYPE